MTVAQATFTQVFRPVTAALFNVFRNKFSGSSLNLDFTNGTLDPRITFSRASTATRVNSVGLIESVAINAPRFDYDPVTLQPKGLLIEEQRTNLLTYSEQFDNAAWVKLNGSTILANAMQAPNGTNTADKFISGTTNGYQATRQSISLASGTICTVTAWMKAAEYSYGVISDTAFGRFAVSFLLTDNGSVAETKGSNNIVSTSIDREGNGWYKCSVTFSFGSVSINLSFGGSPNSTLATGGAWYAGDGTSGIFIWGAQLEAGSFATSYIPTTSAQVTRSADAASITGANFSSWYRADEGTVYSEFALAPPAGTYPSPWTINDGSIVNRIQPYQNSLKTSLGFDVVANGSSQVNILTTVSSLSNFTKSVVSYKVDDFASSANGSVVGTDAVGVVPTVTQLQLGRDASTNQRGAYIKRIAYYPKRLSNTELQGLTS